MPNEKIPGQLPGSKEPLLNEYSEVLSSPDNRMMFVGVPHGSAPVVAPNTVQQVKSVGAENGFYYEGNGDDREHVNRSFGPINYRGSLDNLVNVPDGSRSNFLYTMFSNPPPQTDAMVRRLTGSSSILDALDANRDDVAHEAVRGRLTRDDIVTFLRDTGLQDYADRPATERDLRSFVDRGSSLMWPDNWEEFPNPAGRVAQAAAQQRLRSLTERGSGVYFLGQDNLRLLQSVDPSLRSSRKPQQ